MLIGRGSCARVCVVQLLRVAKKACAARYIVFERGRLTVHSGRKSRVDNVTPTLVRTVVKAAVSTKDLISLSYSVAQTKNKGPSG